MKRKTRNRQESATDLTIGDVARRSGLATSALRYYERVGLLQPTRRVNGQRRFEPNAVRVLNTIRFAREAGFSVAEIRTLFHGFGANVPPSLRWRKLADKKLADLNAMVARVERMRRALTTALQCGCLRIEDCELNEEGASDAQAPFGATRNLRAPANGDPMTAYLTPMARSIVLFILAGICEIGGGYLVWLWLRDRRSALVGALGGVVLFLYGVLPTLQPAHFGRVYAAYGGVFVALSLLWGWWIDGHRPDRADAIGGLVCLVGVAIIMYWPRHA